MNSREFRNVPGSLLEVRVSADGRSGRVIADVMKYNTVDDYRTTFDPGCFSDSLEQRMPRILWAHNPVDPIGQWTDAEDTRDRLRLAGLLDLQMIPNTQTPAVPSAHRAWAQMESRTIDQFSVGFLRQGEDRQRFKGSGVVAITKALLDEASPVLIGSVPGAQLVSVRQALRAPTATGRRSRGLVFFPDLSCPREQRGDVAGHEFHGNQYSGGGGGGGGGGDGASGGAGGGGDGGGVPQGSPGDTADHIGDPVTREALDHQVTQMGGLSEGETLVMTVDKSGGTSGGIAVVDKGYGDTLHAQLKGAGLDKASVRYVTQVDTSTRTYGAIDPQSGRSRRDSISSASAGALVPKASPTGGKFKSGGGRHPAAPRPGGPVHAGSGTKSKADKLAAAKAKYGAGSPQHRAAMKRWG